MKQTYEQNQNMKTEEAVKNNTFHGASFQINNPG